MVEFSFLPAVGWFELIRKLLMFSGLYYQITRPKGCRIFVRVAYLLDSSAVIPEPVAQTVVTEG